MSKELEYTDADVNIGLRVLALCGGDAARASKALASEGRSIGRAKLKTWRTETYARRYQELLNEIQSEIGRETAERAMEIAGQATSVEEKLVQKTGDRIDEIEPKDLARSAVAMSQVKDYNIRSSQLLRDRPTSITEVRNPAEIIRELEALGIAKRNEAIDVDVEEIEDA